MGQGAETSQNGINGGLTLSLDPQRLMDLPYYGMAEKELRNANMWRKTPREQVEDALMDLDNVTDMIQDSLDDIEGALEEFTWN
jgi:hypothetical protein